jgi:glucokinase
MASYENDSRVVMTLDAGGTSFRFSAVRPGNIVEGFSLTQHRRPSRPLAISFAFPDPADYRPCPGRLLTADAKND